MRFLLALALLTIVGAPMALAEKVRRLLASVPGAAPLAQVSVPSRVAVEVRLKMAQGWKLNDGSPTYLALFRRGPAGTAALTELDRASLAAGTAKLPELEPGDYRLQGRIYYCGTGPRSVCFLQPVDLPVTTSAEAAPSIAIAVGP